MEGEERLIARLKGVASPEQTEMLADLLDRVEKNPNGRGTK